MITVTNNLKDILQISIASPMEWLEVIEMAQQENWDPGHGDDLSFFFVDNAGFFIGSLNGKIVAAISVVNFHETYAHLGYYIVRPEFRGRGLGLTLWETAIKHAGDRCIGLDGMPAQEANYSKWGFSTHYHTHRFQGVASAHFKKIGNISAINGGHLPAVIAFDEKFVGYSRINLLSSWFNNANRKGFILTEKQVIKGLIGIRPSDTGYRIGPFYATDASHIESLLHAAMAELPENTLVTIDVPEFASETIALLTSYGYRALFHTCRMYLGIPPLCCQHGNNAVASLELG